MMELECFDTGYYVRDLAEVKNKISAQDYYNGLRIGKREGLAVSAQIAVGFTAISLLENYTRNPDCNNYGILLAMYADKFKA